MKRTTLTGIGFACLQVGDEIDFRDDWNWGRWRKLWRLLTRPRIQYVSAKPTSTTLKIDERRPTWAEWRKMICRALTS